MKKQGKPGDSRDARDNPVSGQDHQKAKADLPLPQPLELATLAAILLPNADPDEALKKAMMFYIEAVLFVRELPPSLDVLIMKFGTQARRDTLIAKPFVQAHEGAWKDTLELDLNKDEDPARQFLSERGLKLKRARSVLDNIRRCCNSLPATLPACLLLSYEEVIGRCQRKKNGETYYEIPKFVLEAVALSAQSRRGETKRKAWRTRQKKSSV